MGAAAQKAQITLVISMILDTIANVDIKVIVTKVSWDPHHRSVRGLQSTLLHYDWTEEDTEYFSQAIKDKNKTSLLQK